MNLKLKKLINKTNILYFSVNNEIVHLTAYKGTLTLEFLKTLIKEYENKEGIVTDNCAIFIIPFKKAKKFIKDIELYEYIKNHIIDLYKGHEYEIVDEIH